MPEITECCVSTAWLKAIWLANASSRKEVSNLVVNIEGLAELGNLEDFSVSTVASTIFPASLWRRNSTKFSRTEEAHIFSASSAILSHLNRHSINLNLLSQRTAMAQDGARLFRVAFWHPIST